MSDTVTLQTEQKCQLTGFFRVLSLASGVFDGIQKLGRCLSRPSVMLDTDGFSALSESVSNRMKLIKHKIFYPNTESTKVKQNCQ
jgi:uncharacterized protein (DUF2384 family)